MIGICKLNTAVKSVNTSVMQFGVRVAADGMKIYGKERSRNEQETDNSGPDDDGKEDRKATWVYDRFDSSDRSRRTRRRLSQYAVPPVR